MQDKVYILIAAGAIMFAVINGPSLWDMLSGYLCYDRNFDVRGTQMVRDSPKRTCIAVAETYKRKAQSLSF